uniref:Lipid-A-disaccharide synthase n=1 Tax=Candidatus Caldatribacterium saccharofermentans TaxID=1454753 RepID=A0A7V4WK24_9BACT
MLLISNGYGEDSFAALILKELLELAEAQGVALEVSIVPLVGEGKAFEGTAQRFPGRVNLLHVSPSFPYGGVYLGSFPQRVFRFLTDAFRGGIRNALAVFRLLRNCPLSFDMVIGVGDILPLLFGLLGTGKKVYLFACAHTDLLRIRKKPYERLGRITAFFFRYGAAKVYTRDAPTALWFQSLGIRAEFLGFVGPEILSGSCRGKNILFLPGHRGDWERNFLFLAETILLARDALAPFALHFVFPPEQSATQIARTIQMARGELVDPSSFFLGRQSISFSQGDYFARLGSASLVVGFAGTALEYAAFCGIPCIEPCLKDAIQANPHFLVSRQALLLREALVPGGDTPEKTARVLQKVLRDLHVFQERAQQFARTTWQGQGKGARNIAWDLLSTLRTVPPKPQDTTLAVGDSRNGTR